MPAGVRKPPCRNPRATSGELWGFQFAVSDDPEAGRRSPPAFRAPNGPLVDLWSCFNGEALYEPERITCPTLLVRGSADRTSTRMDALRLFDRLGARVRRYVEIAHGAHFASAERNAWQVFNEVNAFLRERP